MFTLENTDGYTQETLDRMNESLEIAMLQGMDEKTASDFVFRNFC